MPKFTDENGITWDIRTTVVKVNNVANDASWFAAVDDASDREYSGSGHVAMVDAETFGPPGTDPTITWPLGGNPIIRGKGNEDDAAATLKMFAQRNKGRTDTIALRVKSKGESSMLALVIIAAVILLADKKRR